MTSPQNPGFDPSGGEQPDYPARQQPDYGSPQPPSYGQNPIPNYDQTQPLNQAYPQFGNYDQARIPSYGQIQPNPYAGGPTGYGPVPVPPYPVVPAPYAQPKSQLAAALLAFFLGTLGIHNFYLGRIAPAVVQLVLTLVGWATIWFIIGWFLVVVVGIWAFVEFILILAGVGSYATDAQGVPLA